MIWCEMKVLQINTVCGTGSTGRICADIYYRLVNYGHEGVIAYGRGISPENVSTIRIGSNLDIYMHGMYSRLTDKHGFASEKATINLVHQIQKYDPDIIHLHNIHGYYISIPVLFDYLSKSNKPVVWTLHDCWSFTGHCAHYEYIKCMKWKEGCFDCPQKKEYPASFLQDNSNFNYREKKKLFTSIEELTIITPSNWLARQVKSSFLNKYDIVTINNGINLDAFKPMTISNNMKHGVLEKIPENSFIVLGVANVWTEKKGFSFFLKLAKMLSEKDTIILVGLNEKQLEKIPSNIIGIEQTDSVSELAMLYSLADLYINFTLEEVLGLTNIEALACGTPVLTFNSGGSPECIDDTCGYIIERGDLHAVLESINKVKNSLSTKNACIRRAKQFKASDKFEEYFSLYQRILK